MKPLGSYSPQDLAAIVTVATIASKVAWGGLAQGWHYGAEKVYARARSCDLNLGPFEAIPATARLKCVLIRYGTDKYLEHLAPAQDRFEGRLRNKVREVRPTCSSDNLFTFKASVPVHRRLGTQFKFFFEVDSIEDAEKLKSHNALLQPYVATTDTPIKVWFLVPGFGTQETIEGFVNNFWPGI